MENHTCIRKYKIPLFKVVKTFFRKAQFKIRVHVFARLQPKPDRKSLVVYKKKD